MDTFSFFLNKHCIIIALIFLLTPKALDIYLDLYRQHLIQIS